MSGLDQQKIVVVGAGIFGSAAALALARHGAAVTLVDPAPLGRNTSGMAAGMLAPALEAALDPMSAGRFAILAAARDLWPGFIEGLGPTGLDRCGAILNASPDVVAHALDSLQAQDAEAERVGAGGLFTPEDWRIEPRLAMAALRQGLHLSGGAAVESLVSAVGNGEVVTVGETLEADQIVLATGYSNMPLAPELSLLTPIKGQLLRFPDVAMNEGPILRGAEGYVVPGRDGPVCGATMEAGLTDLSIQSEAVALLQARAAVLAPQLVGARASAMAGVRAATPDGLPLVGVSSVPGVWLAAGARRDGWLLAPMVARLLVSQMAGESGPDPRFDPARFAS